MVKSNAMSLLAARRLIVRRFARGRISREGVLREDLREHVCRSGKTMVKSNAVSILAAGRLIVSGLA